MTKGYAALLLFCALAVPAHAQDRDTLACDFRVLTAAQRSAQTEMLAHRTPALLGDLTEAMSPIPLDAAYVSDPNITHKVMVQTVLARRTPAKSVEVAARIVNCTDYAQQVLAHVSFMDTNQFPTEPTSAWRLIHLEPHSIGTYQEVSIGGANVASYVIELVGNR